MCLCLKASVHKSLIQYLVRYFVCSPSSQENLVRILSTLRLLLMVYTVLILLKYLINLDGCLFPLFRVTSSSSLIYLLHGYVHLFMHLPCVALKLPPFCFDYHEISILLFTLQCIYSTISNLWILIVKRFCIDPYLLDIDLES